VDICAYSIERGREYIALANYAIHVTTFLKLTIFSSFALISSYGMAKNDELYSLRKRDMKGLSNILLLGANLSLSTIQLFLIDKL
jgi:hypothetical protein